MSRMAFFWFTSAAYIFFFSQQPTQCCAPLRFQVKSVQADAAGFSAASAPGSLAFLGLTQCFLTCAAADL